MSVKACVAFATVALLAGVAGCKSRDERAHESALAAAKEKAAVTGTTQTLTFRDKDGSLVTTTIEPPLPGEATEKITVTRTK